MAWYLRDDEGSVRELTANNGGLYEVLAYDAYGNIRVDTGAANGDRFKFAGGQYSAVTGLYDDGARYLLSSAGVWTQPDPIGFAGGDPNPVRYAGNDPVNEVDPSGLYGEPSFLTDYFTAFGNNSSAVGSGISSAATAVDQTAGNAMSYVLTGQGSPEASGVGILGQGMVGLGQGGLNTAQGVANAPVNMGNVVIAAGNYITGENKDPFQPYDFSTGVLTNENPSDHALSVAVGGFGASVLLGNLFGSLFGAGGSAGAGAGSVGGVSGGSELAAIFAAPSLAQQLSGALVALGNAIGGLVGNGTVLGALVGSTGMFSKASGPGGGGGPSCPAPNTTAPASAFHRLEQRSLQSPAKINRLASDMKANGWQGDPIAVFEHGGQKYILDGHHRVAAARQAGIDVPFRSIPESELPSFGYKDPEAVLNAASEAFGR